MTDVERVLAAFGVREFRYIPFDNRSWRPAPSRETPSEPSLDVAREGLSQAPDPAAGSVGSIAAQNVLSQEARQLVQAHGVGSMAGPAMPPQPPVRGTEQAVPDIPLLRAIMSPTPVPPRPSTQVLPPLLKAVPLGGSEQQYPGIDLEPPPFALTTLDRLRATSRPA